MRHMQDNYDYLIGKQVLIESPAYRHYGVITRIIENKYCEVYWINTKRTGKIYSIKLMMEYLL